MDTSSIAGIILALVGILAGLIMEGGRIDQILQPTSAMIVFGGTVGAVMLQYPISTVLSAARQLLRVFFVGQRKDIETLHQILAFAHKARKQGIVSLDQDLSGIGDPFLKQAVMLAVDGTPTDELRKIMQLQLDNLTEHEEGIPAVFESAGGFSPTIGIIGAILGLIQVMQHLNNIDMVGRGIAVAFVATIYGVASANLLFLPVAGKLRHRLHQEYRLRQMTIEGVISILEGMNPHMIEVKLGTYLETTKPKKSESGFRHEEEMSRTREARV